MSSPEDGRPVDLDVERVQRRILTVVVASQVLRGAGLAAVATVGALIAEQLLAGPGAGRLQAALFNALLVSEEGVWSGVNPGIMRRGG